MKSNCARTFSSVSWSMVHSAVTYSQVNGVFHLGEEFSTPWDGCN